MPTKTKKMTTLVLMLLAAAVLAALEDTAAISMIQRVVGKELGES